MIRRALWALQRRLWGLGPESIYQPGRSPSGRLLGPWFVALALGLTLAGCHGFERGARTALDVSAHAIVAVDADLAPRYEAAAAEALAASATADEYAGRMERWNATERALRTARSSLLAAESGIDAADTDGEIRSVVGCVGVALGRVLDALAEVDVSPPPKLRDALRSFSRLGGLFCEVQP